MPPIELPVMATPRVVCAWCQCVMRPGPSSARISHGICGPCAAALRNDLATVDPAHPPVPLHAAMPVPPNLN